jgi:type IV secretory pathway VirB3-like protein
MSSLTRPTMIAGVTMPAATVASAYFVCGAIEEGARAQP